MRANINRLRTQGSKIKKLKTQGEGVYHPHIKNMHELFNLGCSFRLIFKTYTVLVLEESFRLLFDERTEVTYTWLSNCRE